MKVTVLVDNIGTDILQGEWGLSFYIEYNGKHYLLDMGASDLFIRNAAVSGLDMASIDAAVISHAHYDHSGGMEAFFRANRKAPVHISSRAAENCWSGKLFHRKYIGLPAGVIGAYSERIVRHDRFTCIDEGVYIVPHDTPFLNRIGRINHQYIRQGLRYVPDDYSHEISLVLRDTDGLVVLNSCSHSGADIVAAEVSRAFPGERVKSYIGGLHLFRLTEPQVEDAARKLAGSGIGHIYTGHCTGEGPFETLSRELGDRISRFRCGTVI